MWSFPLSCACHTFLRPRAGPCVLPSPLCLPAPQQGIGECCARFFLSLGRWERSLEDIYYYRYFSLLKILCLWSPGRNVHWGSLAAWDLQEGRDIGGSVEMCLSPGCWWWGGPGLGWVLGNDPEHLCAVTWRMCPALGGCKLGCLGYTWINPGVKEVGTKQLSLSCTSQGEGSLNPSH